MRTDANARSKVTLLPRLPFLGALLAASCGGGSFVPASLPLNSAFRVGATIAGLPVQLLLDTGTKYTTLSLAAAERLGLGLVPRAQVTVTDGTGMVRQAPGLVCIERLQLGATTYDTFEAVCVAFNGRLGCDGLVGMHLMRNSVWWFDAPANVLHMLSAEDVDAAVSSCAQRVVARVQLGADRLRPFVRVRLEDRVDVELLLDTGARLTSLPAEVAASLALPLGAALAQARADLETTALRDQLAEQGWQGSATVPPLDGETVSVHGVTEKRSLFHLRQLELGGQRFTDLLVTDSVSSSVLGTDVLAKCAWLLHGPRHELWLLAPQ